MTLLLVRHADAGDRAAWTGDDRARPLSAAGRAQAEALPQLLHDQPIERILSSPARRCLDTVQPLADSRDLLVEDEEALAEATPYDVVDRLLTRAAKKNALLCTHGDVMGAVITTLRRRGALAGVEASWRKGATWVLDSWPDTARAVLLPAPDAS